MTETQGHVAKGFEKVADAFSANFADYPELGAGFALYADGKLQVDLWGGIADKTSGKAWDEQTLQLVFS
ncbi:MAG: serine hydrolase, partial [Ilumatobacter sp.]|nr:serine hydrolase [Ilumatobacter sp.]